MELIEESMSRSSAKGKMKKLPYPEITIHECELDSHEIPHDFLYVLRVIKDGVPYEYLIHRRKESDKLNGHPSGGHGHPRDLRRRLSLHPYGDLPERR